MEFLNVFEDSETETDDQRLSAEVSVTDPAAVQPLFATGKRTSSETETETAAGAKTLVLSMHRLEIDQICQIESWAPLEKLPNQPLAEVKGVMSMNALLGQ